MSGLELTSEIEKSKIQIFHPLHLCSSPSFPLLFLSPFLVSVSSGHFNDHQPLHIITTTHQITSFRYWWLCVWTRGEHWRENWANHWTAVASTHKENTHTHQLHAKVIVCLSNPAKRLSHFDTYSKRTRSGPASHISFVRFQNSITWIMDKYSGDNSLCLLSR